MLTNGHRRFLLTVMMMMMMVVAFHIFFVRLFARLVCVVDKVASGSVGAVAGGVKGAAQFGLVLGVTDHVAHFGVAMGELALFAILADSVLLKRSAQLGLVSIGILLTCVVVYLVLSLLQRLLLLVLDQELDEAGLSQRVVQVQAQASEYLTLNHFFYFV